MLPAIHKKTPRIRRLQKLGKQPKAGIRCDEVTRYILGLNCLLLRAKIDEALFLFFSARRALVHYDTSTLLPSSSSDITEKAYK